jgi:hypothetical protein
MNTKLDLFHPGRGDFGLILPLHLGLCHFPAAVRATTRQFGFQSFVDPSCKRAVTTAAIVRSGLPPWLGRMSFGPAPRERRCLALAGALRLFPGAQQLLHPAL